MKSRARAGPVLGHPDVGGRKPDQGDHHWETLSAARWAQTNRPNPSSTKAHHCAD